MPANAQGARLVGGVPVRYVLIPIINFAIGILLAGCLAIKSAGLIAATYRHCVVTFSSSETFALC